MPRYWVDLGNWEFDLVTDHGEGSTTAPVTVGDVDFQIKLDWVKGKLEELSNGVSGGLGSSLVYKTDSLDEAREVYLRAKQIIEEAFPGDDSMWLSLGITRQPECLQCGYLARFSESYCPKCGAKLMGKEEMV